jgi:hypothetical protein
MSLDAMEFLRRWQDEPTLGPIARQAVRFLDGLEYNVLQSPGAGQSSFSVAKMYEIRKRLKGFKTDAFSGLQESIASLQRQDVKVHLCLIETGKGLISIWFTDESNPPLGIVLARVLSS